LQNKEQARKLLNEREAAELLNVKIATLRKWRLLDRGPNWGRVGARAVRYAPEALEAFIAAGAVTPRRKA
jgi:hypothetical protein